MIVYGLSYFLAIFRCAACVIKRVLLPGLAAAFLAMDVSMASSQTMTDSTESGRGRTFTGSVDTAPGILPQLGVLLRLPDSLQLRDPNDPEPPNAKIAYDRLLPLGAQKVIDRGYSLPLPLGITIIGVDNTQAQKISDLAVALGKGTAPPYGSDLKDLPFVTIDNVVSRTRTKQVKFDAWVFPFLNLFAAIGKVDGSVDLDVVVDLDAAFPPPICTPLSPCGQVSAGFTAGVDAVTATIGAIGVYSFGHWWTSGNLSGTLTAGSNSDTNIKSYTAGLRAGRRFEFGHGNIISPYFGVSYLDIDSVVEGVTSLRNAFPDGDDLFVRYRIQQENLDKWSVIAGLNVGFKNGTSIQAEYNRNTGGYERFVLTASYRF